MKFIFNFWFSFFNSKSLFILAILAVVPGLISVTSCNSGQPVEKKLPTAVVTKTVKAKLDPGCLGRNDTTFHNNDYIKYVALGDSAYDLKVRIGNTEAMLGFSFTCNMPRGLVPVILEHRNGQVVLIRGTGQHYREVLVCSQIAGAIRMKGYETTVVEPSKYDAAYCNSNDSANIVAVDLLNEKSTKMRMPSRNVKSIKLFEIYKDSIVVVDYDNQRFVISL